VGGKKTMKGTVKFFNSEKEFGFITGEDGKDYFVHKTGIQGGVTLNKEDSVTFDVEKGDKGLRAVNTKKA
jgi:CspA family cold shock protein